MDAIVILLICLAAPFVPKAETPSLEQLPAIAPPARTTASLADATARRVDYFSPDGRRLGYAIERRDGTVDIFHPDSSRLGSGVSPGHR
jgi:hypothetical protein